MLGGLGAALRREARRLVEDQRLQILVDHHLAREGDLVFAQRRPFALRLGDDGACLVLYLGFGRRHAQRLARLDPIARRRARAIDAQLAGPRPFGDGSEARVGQMPLEPAIQPDAVVVIADVELANAALVAAHATALPNRPRASISPANSAPIAPATDTKTYSAAVATAPRSTSHADP
ncbi:hypothetical protein WR25_01817 [Diploscapter pachys]|uniref:Uncharacterized protein n=1 Tax=Diploscapter pachys TaxID=2018661 RepID=A0A2A2M4B4_9BILA|nr:hypothetical protein WR25_01817 [Diploscapter pachys]